jgi:membrane-associated phospholipid phosphatase
VRSYTFVDYITQGYLALVVILVLVGHGPTVPFWPILVAIHVVVLGAVHRLLNAYAKRSSSRPLAFLRHFYPVLLYAGFYSETGWLNQMFVHGYLDPVLIGWDQKLFRCQPSLALMEALPFLPISELFYAAYFSYYVMIGGVGFALYLRNRSQFFHYVSVVSFVFYICYVIYIFVPVIGPPIWFQKVLNYSLPENLQQLAPPGGFPAQVRSGIFFHIMKWIYRVFESPGAAIPSSHVAVALCTVYFSFTYLRRIRWIHLVVAVLLCIATVYCRYHYACDVLAGAATALLLVPLGNRLYRKLGPGNVTGQVPG